MTDSPRGLALVPGGADADAVRANTTQISNALRALGDDARALAAVRIPAVPPLPDLSGVMLLISDGLVEGFEAALRTAIADLDDQTARMRAHAGDLEALAASLSTGFPTFIIDYSQHFATATDAILRLLSAQDPPLAQGVEQIAGLRDTLRGIESSAADAGQALARYAPALQNDHDELSASAGNLHLLQQQLQRTLDEVAQDEIRAAVMGLAADVAAVRTVFDSLHLQGNALGLVTDTAAALAAQVAAAMPTLDAARTMWGTCAGILQGVVSDLGKPGASLAASLDVLWVTAARREWETLSEFAQGLLSGAAPSLQR